MTAPEHASLSERSRRLLAQGRFLTLATAHGGTPWAATVNYVALGAPLRLLFYSLTRARHSRDIALRPQVAGSVFMTGLPGFGLDGVQFTGECRAVDASGLAEIHRLYYEVNFPDPAVRAEWTLPLSEFRDGGPRRFYLVTVRELWLLDIERWLADKHDQRVAVPLDALPDRFGE
ncbi:pyridoxamine 5'-phosphate oxidase family protein [Streptomyces axinellae]|uniref:Pyridoxamine 5'-phosphate oxidase N-terminal domain-containing protein n=1 Tax=Streptomyces axinellae TaxID=552788 RepID=A0ABN3PSY4_9ACTN